MKALKKGFLATSLLVGLGGAYSSLVPGSESGALFAQGAAATAGKAVPASLSSGQFVGSREYTFYGYVTVRATIKSGKLTDVTVLEFPNHAGRSQKISSIVLPYLVQEAVSIQSAQVDLISGATLTAEAFALSLDSALKKAGGGAASGYSSGSGA